MNRTKYVDARMILSEEFWSTIDQNRDGELDENEFGSVRIALDRDVIFAVPWLVYPPIETEYHSLFKVEGAKGDSKALFALHPTQNFALPFAQKKWQKWLETQTNETEGFSLSLPKSSDISLRSSLAAMGSETVPESKKYVIPFVTNRNNHVSLTKHVHLSERVLFADATHGIAKNLFKSTFEIHAMRQLPDVIHIFNKDPEQKEEEQEALQKGSDELSQDTNDNFPMSSMARAHLGKVTAGRVKYTCSPTPVIENLKPGGCVITDDTSVLVYGVVRFPASRTQEYLCGVSRAVISVYEVIDGVASEEADYIYADDLGFFNFAATPGTSWKFVATYRGPDSKAGKGNGPEFQPRTDRKLCYAGNKYDDAMQDSSCKNKADFTTSFVLNEVVGGETIVFMDVTERIIDLGLFAGACEETYTGYSFLISPANGCGSSFTITDADLELPSFKENALITKHNSPTVRKWPYAAMDYYIQLDEAPDVSALTETKLVNWEDSNGLNGGKNFVGSSCKPPGSDIMQFFRDRDALVQTLLLLNPEEESNEIVHDEAKYAYHGWFCATPYLNDFDTQDPNPKTDTFYVITGKDDVCLGDGNNDLREKHLIGGTDDEYSKLKDDPLKKKYISMRVMEAHLTSKDEISTCSIFESVTSENLKVTVRLQQDIGPEGEKNPCHSSSLPSDDCVFSKVDAETHFLNFKQAESDTTEHEVGDTSKFYTIDSDGAIPNLIAPYRRKVLARLQRNDGWAVTNLEVKRELVMMGSKVRGGGNDKSARYQSAVQFYATAPVQGLVYSVVHDPPGGDSVASISKGTEITLSLNLATTRGATSSMNVATNVGLNTQYKFHPPLSLGSAYANVLVDLDPNQASAELGQNSGRRLLAMSEEAKFAQAAMKTFGRGKTALPGEASANGIGSKVDRSGVIWKRKKMEGTPGSPGTPGTPAVYETVKKTRKEKYMEKEPVLVEDRSQKIFEDNKKTMNIPMGVKKGENVGDYTWKEGHGYAVIKGFGKKISHYEEVEKEREVEYTERVLVKPAIPGIPPKPAEAGKDAKTYYGSIGSKLGDKKEDKPSQGLISTTFNANTGVTVDGPTVTFDSSFDDGWDFTLTLGRNLDSSSDPSIPGRPGDTILGGGFEIVYVKTDTLDIRPKGAVFAEGEQESEWFDCTDAGDIVPDVVILRGADIDDSVAYSHHEKRQYTRDKIVSDGNHYFVAVNVQNEEKTDYCYSVRLEITAEDKGGKKQCRAEFEDAKKQAGVCSKYNYGDKTFQKPIEPRDAHTIATADGAEGIGLKEVFYVSKTGNSEPPKCLTVVPEIQWLPRVPTSYYSSIFTIESRIIPELEDLIKVVNDPNSLMSDGAKEIKPDETLPEVLKVKEVWRGRLKQSIIDWQNTLDLVSPDYNPEGLLAKTSTEQDDYRKEIDGKWTNDINAALNSGESVFGSLTKDKIGKVSEASSSSINPIGSIIKTSDVYDSVKDTWSKLKDSASDGVDGKKSDASWSDLTVNMALNTAFNSLLPSNTKGALPTWLDGYESGETNVFTPDGDFYARGNASVSESNKFIDGSVYGSKVPFSFVKSSRKAYSDLDDKPEAKLVGEEKVPYLTFSGGGHVISFTQSVNDNVAGADYSWGMNVETTLDVSGSLDGSVSIITAGLNGGLSFSSSSGSQRNVAWSKYANLETTYSLGDPDPYDKFVLQVSTDKRFGTPTFKTIGGASKCPGEPNTMWRESGMILQTEWSSGVNNEFIPPGDDALFDLIITNESPYREGLTYGLVLTTGETWKGANGANMRDLSFSVGNVGGLSSFRSMTPLDYVPSVNSDGDLIHTVMTMRVSKGVFADKYTDIGVKIVSACEFSMSLDWMYRDPISSTAYLGDMKWERECPPVQWDETTMNKYLNYKVHAQSWPVLNYTVLNPNPVNLWSKDKGTQEGKYDHLVHENVEFVRIQWRKLYEGEWINAWSEDKSDADVQCNTARGQGCKLPWNIENQYFMNGLRDGTWEIRAKAFCSGYDSFASAGVKYSSTEENLNLIVDVNQPLAVDASVLNDVFKVDFSESLKCPQLAPSQMPYEIRRMKTCDGSHVDSNVGSFSTEAVVNTFKFVCMNGDGKGSLVAKFPGNVAKGSYELTVNPYLYKAKTSAEREKLLADENGNPVATAKYTATFGCKGSDASSTKAATSASRLGLSRDDDKYKTPKMKKMKKLVNAKLSESVKTFTTLKTTTLLFGLCATVLVAAGVVLAAMSPSGRIEEDKRSSIMHFFRRPQCRLSDASREDNALFDNTSINAESAFDGLVPKTYGSVI